MHNLRLGKLLQSLADTMRDPESQALASFSRGNQSFKALTCGGPKKYQKLQNPGGKL
jgi:hypothetical protein